MHLPRRLGRRVPARCRPRSFPTATTSAGSSTTRPGCPPRGSRRSPPSSAPARRAGPTSRRCRTRSSSSKGQGTIFLARPAAREGGDRGDGHRRGARRRQTSTRRISGVADYLAGSDAEALEMVREIVARLNTTKTFSGDLAPAEDPLYPAEEIYGVLPRDLRRGRSRSARSSRGSSTARASTSSSRATARRSSAASGGSRGFPVGDPRQQRNPLLGVGAQGDALHRDGLPAAHPAPVRPEHHRLHGREGLRARRHRQGRGEDGPRRRERRRPEADAPRRRLVRRRATTACAAAPTSPASSSAGRTRGSASWGASRRPASWRR